MIIGLTGTNGAGKGVVADYLKSLGFEFHSLSDAIRDEIRDRGQEISRETLIRTGNELRENFGPSILAQRIAAKVSSSNAVIDSVRNSFEVTELRKQDDFFLLAIDAPPQVRFERAMKRGRNESADTLEAFIALENREKSSSSTAQQIDKCMAMADHTITNNRAIDDLHGEIDSILKIHGFGF